MTTSLRLLMILAVLTMVWFLSVVYDRQQHTPPSTPSSPEVSSLVDVYERYPNAVALIAETPCNMFFSSIPRAHDMNCVLDFYGFSSTDHVMPGEPIARAFQLLEECRTCVPGVTYQVPRETKEELVEI